MKKIVCHVAGSRGEIQLADAINIHTQLWLLEALGLKRQLFDCGSMDGLINASNHEYNKRLVI